MIFAAACLVAASARASELIQGHTSEEALRRAKVAVNHPRYSHPFYWSSLVMLGDGTGALVREPISQPISPMLLAIGLSLVAVVVAVAKLRKTV